MRGKFFLLITLLSLLAGCKKDTLFVDVPLPRLMEDQVLQSQVLNRSIEYAVLLPEDYNDTEDQYPVVYLLHGYGENETAWYTNGGLQYYVDANLAETGPMIYVMPQAFNSYYIDRYSGTFSYMEMFVDELVPEIDARFRTKKDKSQRAVMGYSMGGYGALILPAMHPETFSISIPLSMSFRTDEQYVAESQGAFDNQWAPNFGPAAGVSGAARLTDYFKIRSPFHFYTAGNTGIYNNLKVLIDCGDDEEALIFTSNRLHSVMRETGVMHEYRVRSGGHSFDYWRKSYPEALKFISNAMKGIPHPDEPTPAATGTLILQSDLEEIEISETAVNILKPVDYATSGVDYPVLYIVHDDEENQSSNLINTFSLLRNSMGTTKMVKSILVEIPAASASIELIEDVVAHVDANYRTKEIRDNRVILSNGNGVVQALQAAVDLDLFSDCFIFNGELPDEALEVSSTVFYYVDGTDKSASYLGYENLYLRIRNEGTDGYEYRVRQGAESYQAFLNGLSESFPSLKESLNR